MKICVLQSSYEGADSPFQQVDAFADPSRYVKMHDFYHRYIFKDTAKQQIDAVCAEKFDMYLNILWGQPNDPVAGVEAVKYLESKGVPVVGLPSNFLSKTKLDFQDAALKHGVRIPGTTNFPKIIKPANGCGSLHMTEDSVCHTAEALEEQLHLLKEKVDGRDVVVQEFIVGDECSAIVLEMGDNVVALTPLMYQFPADMPPEKCFLHWKNKYDAVDQGIIKYAFVEDEPRSSRIKDAAVAAFRALGVTGGGAWARVDMRIDERNDAYVLEVNPMPATFYPIGNSLGDDLVVQETFPGGHEAFMNMVLTTKLFQMRAFDKQVNGVRGGYAAMAPKYDEHSEKQGQGMRAIQSIIATKFDLSGSVLDLGCGTGLFGEILHEHWKSSKITGVDISPEMTKNTRVRKHYSNLHVGSIQEVIMSVGRFDHIVGFGVMHFLNPTIFSAVLSRMFQTAHKSISLEIDEIPDKYNKHLAEKYGMPEMYSWNHSTLIKDFGVPKGWKVVCEERRHVWNSPTTGDEVWGLGIRYEKIAERSYKL